MNARQLAELITILILVGWNVWQYFKSPTSAILKTLKEMEDRLGPAGDDGLAANPERCRIEKEAIDKLEVAVCKVEERLGSIEGDLKVVKAKQNIVLKKLGLEE